jgi:large subunit ribosomal protein L31
LGSNGIDPKLAGSIAMKEGIHPDYRAVVFQDVTTDFAFLTRSTKKTKDTIQWTDGKTYPLVKIDVSSKSHPFYTGKHKTRNKCSSSG